MTELRRHYSELRQVTAVELEEPISVVEVVEVFEVVEEHP